MARSNLAFPEGWKQILSEVGFALGRGRFIDNGASESSIISWTFSRLCNFDAYDFVDGDAKARHLDAASGRASNG